jgi:hypothetical protein
VVAALQFTQERSPQYVPVTKALKDYGGSVNNNDDKYGVLLFPQAIEELGKAIESYLHDGSVGKYIYCKQLTHLPGFVALTITP